MIRASDTVFVVVLALLIGSAVNVAGCSHRADRLMEPAQVGPFGAPRR
jgi:hypothetical protein